MRLKSKLCSSLVKVMPDREPGGKNYCSGSALQGEIFSFQMAYRADYNWVPVNVDIQSELKPYINCRSVELVPAEYPVFLFDDDYEDTRPGLYPDRLQELPPEGVKSVAHQWRSLWFKVTVPEDMPAGKYEITITLSSPKTPGWGGHAARRKQCFTLKVLPLKLPEQTLKHTNWFHADCLATYYRQEVFSEEHWKTLENFFRCAADHGINLLLTPLFTPPLDTVVGGERPTVQLVKVFRENGRYSFDLSLLTRWIKLAQKCGITHFEMSHLFTQWGAEYTPKIIAVTDGVEKRIFGWDVRADSQEYAEFLSAFLPVLTDYFRKENMVDKVYFHTSDEPSVKHRKSYAAASKLLKKYIGEFRTIDALSSVEFYKSKLVALPVPLVSAVEAFIEAGVPEVWTYYCCGPMQTYSNRFIAMSSSRNRILGSQLYYYNVSGFLHWGFNFYYSRYSLKPIDPYRNTDSDAAFPAGDPFVVYPGKAGIPEVSLRLEVFYEALQDQRALQLLESFMPRRRILKMLDKLVPEGKMSMKDYPRGEENVLKLRQKINALLEKYAAAQ